METDVNRMSHRTIVELQLNPNFIQTEKILATKRSIPRLEKMNSIKRCKRQKKIVTNEIENKTETIPEVKSPQLSDTETESDDDHDVNNNSSKQAISENGDNGMTVAKECEQKQNTIIGSEKDVVVENITSTDSLKIRDPSDRKKGVCSIIGCTNQTKTVRSMNCSQHILILRNLREKARSRKVREKAKRMKMEKVQKHHEEAQQLYNNIFSFCDRLGV